MPFQPAGSSVVSITGPVDVSGSANVGVTGAQAGATAAGGFTVPDKSTTASTSSAGTSNQTISAVAGKAQTCRTLLGHVAGTAGATGGLLTMQITITDVLSGTTLFDTTFYGSCPATSGAPGNGDFQTDLLGLAGSVGGALRLTVTTSGGGGLGANGNATLLTKAV